MKEIRENLKFRELLTMKTTFTMMTTGSYKSYLGNAQEADSTLQAYRPQHVGVSEDCGF